MNPILFAALLIILLFTTPFALASDDRADEFEQRMAEARARLELTDEQPSRNAGSE